MATATATATADGPIIPQMVDPATDEPGSDGRPVREWTMHPWQLKGFMATERFVVFPAGRRCGKSEFAVMWVLERYREARMRGTKGVIWIVYPTYQIARTAWRKFKRLAPRGWVAQYLGTEQSPQAIILRGGVTIEFRSGANPGSLVGEGLLAAWVDECGEIKERVWGESLRPTLADHVAPALLTGTPKGHNWFWREFQRGWDPGFADVASLGLSQAQGVPTHENPYLDPEEVEAMGRDLSKRLHDQEVLAKFLTKEGAVFNIERAREKGLRYSTKPTAALGIDIARRMDFTVMIGMDRDFGVTHFERFNNIDWPLQKGRIERAWLKLDRPAIVIDATGVGDAFTQELQYMGLPVEPFVFTAISKRQLVESLAVALDTAIITLPDEPVLLNELEAFDMTALPSGNVRYSAPEGQHDDCVCSLGMALRGAMRYGDLGITIGRIQ